MYLKNWTPKRTKFLKVSKVAVSFVLELKVKFFLSQWHGEKNVLNNEDVKIFNVHQCRNQHGVN